MMYGDWTDLGASVQIQDMKRFDGAFAAANPDKREFGTLCAHRRA